MGHFNIESLKTDCRYKIKLSFDNRKDFKFELTTSHQLTPFMAK